MVKKMLYFLALAATAYMEIMYDSTWLLTLLAFELTLAAAMFMLSLYFRRNIRISLKTKVGFASKNDDILLEIYVENRSWLPVCGILIDVGYGTVYAKQTEYRVVREHVRAKGRKKITVTARSKYAGCMRFFIRRTRVGDYLNLFSWNARRNGSPEARVDVLPDMHLMPVEATSRAGNFQTESFEYETDRGGDDPSEVFQIREYRGGDRMRQIHWKMSARTDNLMVKEYSMPKQCRALLLLENAGRCVDSAQADLFFEIAASVSGSLADAGCIHCAAWYDAQKGEIIRRVVQTEEDVYEVLSLLMSAVPDGQERDLEEAYRFAYPQENYGVVLRADMQGRLRRNGGLMEQFDRSRMDQKMAECLLEV